MKTFKLLVLVALPILLFYACSKEEDLSISPEQMSNVDKFEVLKKRAQNLETGLLATEADATEDGARVEANPEDYLILYSSNRKGYTNSLDNKEIWVMDLSGDEDQGTLQLTDDNAYECYWPRVSPDKTKMLFYRTPRWKEEHHYNHYALWMMDLTSFEVSEVIPLSRYDWKRQGTADWSPDGTKLVMFAQKSDGQYAIIVTNPEGDVLQEISNGGKYTDPSWSPDGQSICFAKDEEIYILNLNNPTLEQQITCDNDFAIDADPYWSPDGTEIVFETWVRLADCLRGRWDLRSVKLSDLPSDGSCSSSTSNVILGRNGRGHSVPRWSSDSNYLVFHYGNENCSVAHLALCNRDGTGFITENIQGRKYRKTSPDIYEF